MSEFISKIYRTKIGMELLLKTGLIGVVYVVSMIVLTVLLFNKTNQIYLEIGRLDNLNVNVHSLIQALVDQETGQRGYNLTGEKQFLKPYNQGTKIYSELSAEIKSNSHSYPSIAAPLNQMIEKGLYWHNHYGAQQVKWQERGTKVTSASLNAGKNSFDDFRASSKIAIDKITSLKGEQLQLVSTLSLRYHLLLILTSVLLFSILILWMLSAFKKIAEPILEVRLAIKELSKGNFDVHLPYDKKHLNEISDLVSSLTVMRYQLQKTINDTKQLAETDALTGIYNRGYFDHRLDELISIFYKYGKSFSLILIDIDHFKMFNDKFGHTEGDRVLRHVTDIISAQILETDVFARYGGEEFAILTTVPDAGSYAERLRKSITLTPLEDYHITASFGICEFQKGDGAKSCIDRADQALYMAKKNGRNRVEFGS
ncbi:diguanylate cyclase [Bacillus sp. BRMEA1]|uniref:sensor domain-containing diguanylate cyclase n=1 Tax=Neobacillus endophyticus TaxID=2738405 RepID=UPI0015677702|nr:diguanylate cyclase [Neobacillus endophyticus]NRD77127.1 diguanylate cyclase [Neobacillus endophyticus]